MDWHAWLSAARLDPALVYEYALVLARNEVDAGDVAYFDHEFLHSMGISVAKHRLEILKLARRRLSSSSSSGGASLSRNVLAAVGRVARCARSLLLRRRGGVASTYTTAALVLVDPIQQQQHVVDRRASSRSGWVPPKRMRSKPKPAASVHAASVAIGGGKEMVRWDSMFQDLKPN